MSKYTYPFVFGSLTSSDISAFVINMNSFLLSLCLIFSKPVYLVLSAISGIPIYIDKHEVLELSNMSKTRFGFHTIVYGGK